MCAEFWICNCGYKNCGDDVWCIRCLTIGAQFIADLKGGE